MVETGRAIRYELDARAERAVTRLRLTAALLVTFAGAWLMALPYPVPRVFALVGFAFAALWVARALRQRGGLDPSEHYLELAPDALRLREGESVQEVLWPEVSAVYVDEDRLIVRVARSSGPAVEIEPRYRGAGLHDLFEAVKNARERARACSSATGGGCVPPVDG